MADLDVKQLAMMKQEFIKSDFGTIAAEQINAMIGRHLADAQKPDLEPWQKAYHVERAGAIQEVITWFTADVALLEAGGFKDEEEEQQE